MRAVWYERTGPAAEVLTYGEMPTPVAGASEVRVKLEASGVNPADVGRRGGCRPMEYPRVIPNSDGAGIIDQVGDSVTRLKLGQRVWLFNGQRNGRAFGTAAEHIALAEHLVDVVAVRGPLGGRRLRRRPAREAVVLVLPPRAPHPAEGAVEQGQEAAHQLVVAGLLGQLEEPLDGGLVAVGVERPAQVVDQEPPGDGPAGPRPEQDPQ